LSVASNIQWYALIPHKAYSFITTLFLGPFDDVITKFYCIMIDELGSTWKENCPGQIEYYPNVLLGRTGENHENCQSG
jgi:hypothetical protein